MSDEIAQELSKLADFVERVEVVVRILEHYLDDELVTSVAKDIVLALEVPIAL